MPTLLRNNWSLGWNPNSDDKQGDVRGLLRADNLTYDEQGILSLIRGTKKISSNAFNPVVTQIFGKTWNLADMGGSGYPNNAKVRYCVSGDNVFRNYDATNKAETAFGMGFITGGGTGNNAAFGFGFGHVFCCYGSKKRKDAGLTQSDIGIDAPPSPGVSVNAAPEINASSSFVQWEIIENGAVFNNTANYLEIDAEPSPATDSNTYRAISMRGWTYSFSLDSTAFGGTTGRNTDDDIFKMSVRIGDTSTFVKVRIEFKLDAAIAPSGYVSDMDNYFAYEWDLANYKFNLGVNEWTTVQCRRKDFERHGTDDALNWATITGIRITFVGTTPQTYVLDNMFFVGGTTGPLEGYYKYIQVDVQNNGIYLEKSLPSAETAEKHAIKASIQVSPTQVDPAANECWIFRIGGGLNQYYRIKVLSGAYNFSPAAFSDTLTDEQALRDGIILDAFQDNLPNDIIGMECNWKGRNWYVTPSDLYPSYRDNYSAYDTRYKIEIAGRNTEYIQFITRLSADVLVISTNLDFYEITGSAGVILAGETEIFDINIRPLGIKSPSIAKTFVVREGNLFYLAADGVRILSGSTVSLVTERIDLLFNNHTRHGIAPVKVVTNLSEFYYLAISKNRLFVSVPQTDNVRALFVFDFDTKLWRYEEHGNTDSISALFVEEDDTILYSTASFGDRYLRILDIGTLFDEANNINFKFLTVFDDNNQPKNRKDSFTFKIEADSGGGNVTITIRGYTGLSIASETNIIKTVTTTLAFPTRIEVQSVLTPGIGTVKSYQIELSGTVPKFKLYNISIDYEQRPEQLTYLRIPPTNYGIAGRKRIYEIPMIIDTLGNNVQFIPLLDNIQQTISNFGTGEKALQTHLFTSEKAAFDIGGILHGTLFEFYELVQPREIELLPDPLRYKFVPYSNLGTGSRKRFIQYALVIDTRGVNVTMTPKIDGTDYPPLTINTNRKATVIYTFNQIAVGVDIACVLQGSAVVTDTPFEFYGVNLDESVFEKLPPKAKAIQISCTNYGVAAKKRIRTMPMVIDTFGNAVTFTPSVDGVPFPGTTFNTNRKATVLHYFENNGTGAPFGIDYCGTLIGANDFEFYGLIQPENVETLPVGKKFDQFGPVQFEKIGKVRMVSIRMVATGSLCNFRIFSNDSVIVAGTFSTTPNIEKTYDISIPKGVNPNIFRMEIDSTSVFHRFDVKIRVNVDGNQTANKIFTIK